MSATSYNNNNNMINNGPQMPLQSGIAPPQSRRPFRRGGVYGGNQRSYGGNQQSYGGNQQYYGRNQQSYGRNQQYYGQNQQYYGRNQQSNQRFYQQRIPYRNNQFNYRNNRNFYPNFNRQNMNQNMNRNYPQQQQQPYNNDGYGLVSQPPSEQVYRQRINSRINSTVNSRTNSRQGSPFRQQRHRGPRPMHLSDFMPVELQDTSSNAPNLPADFILASNPATRPQTPIDALPQRQNVANTTQPFTTTTNAQPEAQQTTTASFRRRQRRFKQQQFNNNKNQNQNQNRFAVLENEETNSNFGDNDANNIGDNNQQPARNDKLRNNKQKKKRLYLEPNRIMRYMQDNFSTVISGRGNQAYTLATTSIYDEWVRNNYELQVWQTYLKLGTEQKHWAKEVVQRTKKRDDIINTRFVQKKINQLTMEIAQTSATISDMQIQLNTYWGQTTAGAVSNTNTTTAAAATTTSTSTTNRARDSVDRLEKTILRYVHYCTQHVKKMAEMRIQLAKAQMEEFKALEDFEQISTPLQWNIHLTLKPKMKIWSTKNKNYRTAVKRVEYDLPPKFISKLDFTFKVDESILCQEEAQALYNQMRQITKDFRTQAMTLYVQSTTREHELLTSENNLVIKGFPQENDQGFDCEAGFAAFKHYHELREKRINLEAEHSIYFLDVERAEGEPNNNNLQEEEIIAPTLTRALGEDFLLQQ